MKPTFIALLALCLCMVGADNEPLIADPIVEKAIRKSLKKPKGELTKADLEKVTDLEFRRFKITDAGLKEVVKLKNLQTLGLASTKITNASLKEVIKLQKLTHLSLVGTKITNTGLKEIAKMKQLESLHLYLTGATKAGVAELQKALPNCYIIGGPFF